MKEFTIKEVKPKIFLLKFEDQYNLAMHFLRYQEFYESPNPKFRNHAFTLIDFMDWYSHAFGYGTFAYPEHWIGFNIPDGIILKANLAGIPDFNRYDEAMLKVHQKCATKYPNERFYIIGATTKSGSIMKHEIAHGFFYNNEDYKEKMSALVADLKPSFRRSFFKALKRIGYTSQVYVDECQAYLSTAVPAGFEIKIKNEDKPFVKLYNEYYTL